MSFSLLRGTVQLPGDSTAMLFWRAMCDRADERLTTYLRTYLRLGYAQHPEQLSRFIVLTAYCRRRYWRAYWQAFDERRSV